MHGCRRDGRPRRPGGRLQRGQGLRRPAMPPACCCRERPRPVSPPRLRARSAWASRSARTRAAASLRLPVGRSTVRRPGTTSSSASVSGAGVSSMRWATTSSLRREPALRLSARRTALGRTMRPALSMVRSAVVAMSRAVGVAGSVPSHLPWWATGMMRGPPGPRSKSLSAPGLRRTCTRPVACRPARAGRPHAAPSCCQRRCWCRR